MIKYGACGHPVRSTAGQDRPCRLCGVEATLALQRRCRIEGFCAADSDWRTRKEGANAWGLSDTGLTSADSIEVCARAEAYGRAAEKMTVSEHLADGPMLLAVMTNYRGRHLARQSPRDYPGHTRREWDDTIRRITKQTAIDDVRPQALIDVIGAIMECQRAARALDGCNIVHVVDEESRQDTHVLELTWAEPEQKPVTKKVGQISVRAVKNRDPRTKRYFDWIDGET